MKNRYKDYGYSSVEPGNKDTNKLTALIVSIIKKQVDVKTICDLGCGNGYLAGMLAASGYEVTGIDASKSGIEIAKKYYKQSNIKLICKNIHDMSTEIVQSEFDFIVSIDVLEHLYRPADLIEVARRLLKPNGCLLISTPYHGYLKNLILGLLNKWDPHHRANWDGGHIKFFSIKTLKELLANYGFLNVQFYFYGRMPLLWKNMICLSKKDVLNAKER